MVDKLNAQTIILNIFGDKKFIKIIFRGDKKFVPKSSKST